MERRQLGRGQSSSEGITFGRKLFAFALLVLFSATPSAQTSHASTTVVEPLLEDVTRVESWSFFDPPRGGGDPDYALFGNQATLGVRVNGRRVSFQGSFRYAQMLGLPRFAVGPGPLGPGALFFAAAGNPKAYQLYFKSMSLRLKNPVQGLSVEGGRMAYESGERTPFAGRLIGNAEWTVFGRAFDGVRVDYERPAWRAHGSFVMPTQGAFEESGNPTLSQLQIATVSWGTDALQLFAHNYRDDRAVRGRPDNTQRVESRADINIQTFGASFARTFSRAGTDVRTWAAVQRGRWYDLSHRAFSASAEASYRSPAPSQTTIAAGLLYASGDDDIADGKHQTFFPMVPTTRPDVLAGTYAQMNLRDLHVRVTFRPHHTMTATGEAHRLSLATPFDRWYSGTGATALRGGFFGYSTRLSQLATGLGTYVQASAEARIAPRWTLKAAAGIMKGGDVVRRQFADDWLRVIAVESRIQLR